MERGVSCCPPRLVRERHPRTRRRSIREAVICIRRSETHPARLSGRLLTAGRRQEVRLTPSTARHHVRSIVSASTAPGVSPAIATGTKCSVRPCVALSISTCRVAPTSDASRFCNAASPPPAIASRAALIALARDLRHPRRRRARPRRIGKHVQEGEVAFLHQILRAREHLLGLGRKARDDIGAERDVRPQPPHLRAELDRVLRANAAASSASESGRRRTAATDADAASAVHHRR
mgnify:CR=1 FL=1